MTNPIKNCVWKDYPQGNITQWFGENPELYSKAVCFEWNGKKECLKGHNGIDIVAPWGTPLYAIETGKICDVKDSPTGYGMHIRLLAQNTEWTYGHLSRIDVKLGQEVKEGEQIGLMGNTGFVISGATPYWEYNPYAGTHCHLGKRKLIRTTNSLESSNLQYGTGDRVFILIYENGYWGSVDFANEFKQIGEEKEKQLSSIQLTIISLANQVVMLLQKLLAMKNK